ncbi:Phosphatidylinositol N-acetylglucosaminyltransferase subunit q [Nymphaea thermarum]|nr:Phosphatidylinositol N-acetylglucosaminyltransferase subunit q [Nymphaea thermarum]
MQTRCGQCRLWWPSYLAARPLPESDFLLFGWFLPPSSASNDLVDVVVATTASLPQLSPSQLEANLDNVNGATTSLLQEHSKFSILGHYLADYSNIVQKTTASASANEQNVTEEGACLEATQTPSGSVTSGSSCPYCSHVMESCLDHCLQHFVGQSCWIQLCNDNHRLSTKKLSWVPQLHHMHWNGLLLICNFHVIIYEQPVYGVHHYSLNSWCLLEQARTQASFASNIKKPKWVQKLEQKGPSPTLICHKIMKYWLLSPLCMILSKLFRHTWKNVHIRSCQLVYWPIYLRGSGIRHQACVEYAHKDAVRKHSMWLSIILDVILGNIFGLSLLCHLDAVCTWYSLLVHNVTNNILRSGCVWLMGVPAGFKLNTELAEMLGVISLNVIQVWSTFWFFMRPFLRCFAIGLSISGILFGMTVAEALCLDMIFLVTSHLSTLNWLISLLYAQQLQALASLWRIFRGRKWNPLRLRLDSYDYSVKEHVVGSLLFSPLLLLLPTTSVFYIFFTIINSTITFICIFIEVSISILHAIPCPEIFFWIIQPRRFPSGIWFEILSGFTNQQMQGRPERIVSVLNISSTSLGCGLDPHQGRIRTRVASTRVRLHLKSTPSLKEIPDDLFTSKIAFLKVIMYRNRVLSPG